MMSEHTLQRAARHIHEYPRLSSKNSMVERENGEERRRHHGVGEGGLSKEGSTGRNPETPVWLEGERGGG